MCEMLMNMYLQMVLVKLLTKDAQIIEVESDVIRCANAISFLVEEQIESGAAAVPIPLATIESRILAKILVWCEHHKDDVPVEHPNPTTNPPTPQQQLREEYVSSFDRQFMNESNEDLLLLTAASHFLGIDRLFKMLAGNIAIQIHLTK